MRNNFIALPIHKPLALDFARLPDHTSYKVLFVYPNPKYRKAHLGLATLSACLKHIGAATELCDLTGVPAELRQAVVRSKLKRSRPDLVAVTAMSPDWPAAAEVIRLCKGLGVVHVIGGAQATEQPEETMRLADMLVVGEGEGALMDIVRALAAGKPAAGIANVWSRQPDGEVVKTERRELIANLDDLPFPDWRLFHNMHYESPPDFWTMDCIHRGQRLICAPIEGSRGCPYRCTYCSNAAKRNAYRGKGRWRREKSPERIIAELKAFREAFGALDRVMWVDEIFLTGTARLRRLCEQYKREINVPFSIKERPEQITEAKIRMAARAGLMGMSIGFESGDEGIRQGVLNRQMPAVTLEQAFAVPRKYGVRTCAYTMVGLPGEDQASLLRTWQALRRIRPDIARFTVFRPVRGTVLYEQCVRAGLHDPANDTKSWSFAPIMKHDVLDDDTIVRHHRLLTRYTTAGGLWPVVAFRFGRKSRLAYRLLQWAGQG